MQAINLPLFELDSPKLVNNHVDSFDGSEEKIVAPLTQVLDHISPISADEPKQNLEQSQTFSKALNSLFPEQTFDEKDIQKAKEILGDTAKKLSTQQLESAVTEVKYLAESWLDDFERSVFEGKTLKELLHNKD